jgi:hypothetical protein
MRVCHYTFPLLLLAAALLGCRSEPALDLAAVHGRVSLAGKGLSHATIQLIPDEKKGTTAPTGAGQTDEEGRFQITTPPHGDGAVPGHYKVTVSAYSGKVPQRYSDPVKTPLSVEVPAAGLEDWKLELTTP